MNFSNPIWGIKDIKLFIFRDKTKRVSNNGQYPAQGTNSGHQGYQTTHFQSQTQASLE